MSPEAPLIGAKPANKKEAGNTSCSLPNRSSETRRLSSRGGKASKIGKDVTMAFDKWFYGQNRQKLTTIAGIVEHYTDIRGN